MVPVVIVIDRGVKANPEILILTSGAAGVGSGVVVGEGCGVGMGVGLGEGEGVGGGEGDGPGVGTKDGAGAGRGVGTVVGDGDGEVAGVGVTARLITRAGVTTGVGAGLCSHPNISKTIAKIKTLFISSYLLLKGCGPDKSGPRRSFSSSQNLVADPLQKSLILAPCRIDLNP